MAGAAAAAANQNKHTAVTAVKTRRRSLQASVGGEGGGLDHVAASTAAFVSRKEEQVKNRKSLEEARYVDVSW